MKAVGVLIIGLGLVLIVIGIMGTQSKVLDSIKGLSPKLRTAAAGSTTANAATGAIAGAATGQETSNGGTPSTTSGVTPGIA